MKHLISTENLGPTEIKHLLDKAALIKSSRTVGGLEGKNLGMLFFDPSLRTQTSFSVGMKQLGGSVTVLSVGQGVWDLEVEDNVIMDGDKAEHVREAAPVLSRYFDALAVRAFPLGRSWEKDSQDPVLNSFARHATVPRGGISERVPSAMLSPLARLSMQNLGVVSLLMVIPKLSKKYARSMLTGR